MTGRITHSRFSDQFAFGKQLRVDSPLGVQAVHKPASTCFRWQRTGQLATVPEPYVFVGQLSIFDIESVAADPVACGNQNAFFALKGVR